MWYFGEFQFDDAARTLSSGAADRALTPKACDLLSCLLTQAGTVIPLQSLLSIVWREIHVEPENVRVLVSELRRALGDDARHPRFIRTYPGRGYVFMAPATTAVADGHGDAQSAPRLIGRELELVRLEQCIEAARRGESSFALVTGDVGVGKSALCEAFVEQAQLGGAIRVVDSRCVEPFGASDPDDPVRDILDSLAGPTGESIGEQELYPPDGSAVAAAAAFARLADGQPLLVVVHDIHRAALRTIRLLADLVSSLHAPVMFLLTGRVLSDTPGGTEMARLQSRIARAPGCAVLTLGAFTREAVAALVTARLGAGPVATLANPLHDVTDGNPFLAVTALEGCVTRGFIHAEGGTWAWTIRQQAFSPALTACVVPALEWRLDQLDDLERRILETAAFLGQTFAMRDVAEMAGESAELVSDVLERVLGGGGLITRAACNGAATADRRYQFIHRLSPRLLALHASSNEIRKARGRSVGRRTRHRWSAA